jgi:hypothetical protein
MIRLSMEGTDSGIAHRVSRRPAGALPAYPAT